MEQQFQIQNLLPQIYTDFHGLGLKNPCRSVKSVAGFVCFWAFVLRFGIAVYGENKT